MSPQYLTSLRRPPDVCVLVFRGDLTQTPRCHGSPTNKQTNTQTNKPSWGTSGRSLPIRLNKPTNARRNKRTNEQTNERTNERTSKQQTNKRTDKQTNQHRRTVGRSWPVPFPAFVFPSPGLCLHNYCLSLPSFILKYDIKSRAGRTHVLCVVVILR